MRRPTSPTEPRGVVSRRTTLALALGGTSVLGVALSGCDLGDLDRDLGTTPSPAGPSPDVALTERVLADVDARLAAVVAARASAPGLQGPLLGLQEMHEAHRAVLDPVTATPGSSASSPSPTTPTTTAAAAPTGPPARVLRRLRAAETTHQAALVEAAVEAGSGALARLLASMSASVAQHLALLPARPDAS